MFVLFIYGFLHMLQIYESFCVYVHILGVNFVFANVGNNKSLLYLCFVHMPIITISLRKIHQL